MLLAANLIVRNEAAHLPDCLASLREVADEVVVYDTGSTDDTVAIARQSGAVVVQGYWDEDFARARNAALDATTADWVLAVDADERWDGDSGQLRRHLTAAPARMSYAVTIVNVAPDFLGGDFSHRGSRLFRRAGTRWAGAVHELPDGPQLRRQRDLPTAVGSLVHLGYADPDVLKRKSERNAELAQAELDRLVAERVEDPEVAARVLFELGRSFFGAGRKQDALDTFEALRGLTPRTRLWVQATDFLVRLLQTEGHDEVVLALVEQLREAGVDRRWCDWLAAPALCELGRPAAALPGLREIDLLRDAGGREYDLGQVRELHALVAGLAGSRDEALAAMVAAMAVHGRVAGRGELLLRFWPGDGETLGQLLADADAGGEHRDALVAELSSLDVRGRGAAAVLAAR